ncbi:uncharacterized protein J7T54_000575 [Emericellopsis cladophorae]|uniref:Uncharacterized protein n=1 Tax=Emericellopsis cladophorae TaxID=2686198 RepID=A0A9P9Y3R8_9HYPO|nr:uncharacterized protein J7T54_000575 [Emericellopsis cladophorae]KAI6783073.1 hypothetical protein J7T54_000575 [Emericellopsis cladophorae]
MMLLHGSAMQSPRHLGAPFATTATPTTNVPNTSTTTNEPSASSSRKRKAESQPDERLVKRLGRLNIEKDGSKLYVPVENPTQFQSGSAHVEEATDPMAVDDSKHKVYIYNLDDELSSSDTESEDRLVFLPDIDRHLRQNRIPPHILANSEGELAGMQMVLYSDPKSLSVPESKDSVRKAIIEARQRLRDQQGGKMEATDSVHSPTVGGPNTNAAPMQTDAEAMDLD